MRRSELLEERSLFHSELMLLVDNDELQFIECHIILDDGMRSHQRMDSSLCEILFYLIFLTLRYCSRK